jgi:hypothetical protein
MAGQDSGYPGMDDDDEVEGEVLELEDGDLEIEIEDDTPDEDKGKTPMPAEIVEDLEADELEEYTGAAKVKLKQLKKVWHDERREKERVLRENAEAVSYASRLLEENKRLKQTVNRGEEYAVSSATETATLELEQARREYKQAYELGDSDKLLEAQEQLSDAQDRLRNLKRYKPSLQEEDTEVAVTEERPVVPTPDANTQAWQKRNTWFGTDEEMTATALGLHQKLTKQNGDGFVGTADYWRSIDSTMARRFPEYFGDKASRTSERRAKPSAASSVVAPATRSTSSRKIVLKSSQAALARKFGLTNEQYAAEQLKLDRKS